MADLEYRGVKVTVPDEVAERLPSDYKKVESAPAKRASSKSDDK